MNHPAVPVTTTASAHTELPRSADLPRLPYRFGQTIRRPARLLLGRRYEIVIHDDHLVPRAGPALLASNHLGLLDGPVLWSFAPRMVHALIKRELFVGQMARGLLALGQISVERTEVDPLAVRRALRVLRDGRVLAIYPEGSRGSGDFTRFRTGVAYLALATGAPVVPVACLGTRVAGRGIGELSPRGTRVDIVFGEPMPVTKMSFPRRQPDVRTLAAELHAVLRAHVQRAVADTGNPLPGDPGEELE